MSVVTAVSSEFISDRLNQNLRALELYYPELYGRFYNYAQKSNIRLVINQSGEPDVYFPSSDTLLYSGQSFAKCLKIANDLIDHLELFSLYPALTELDDPFTQIHFEYRNRIVRDVVKELSGADPISKAESFPCILQIGLGLGYQLGYLYEKMTPLHLYVIEPDPDLFFLSLCCFDYPPLLNYIHENNLHLEFRIGNDFSNLIDELDVYFNWHPVAFAAQCFWIGYHSSVIKQLMSLLSENFASITLKLGFFDDLMFSFAHGVNNISSGIPVLYSNKTFLSDYMRKFPLLLVGNGPSLDDDMDFIKKNQDRFVIMACGTAFATLCRCGIKSDIYIALERGVNVYDSLMAIKEHREYFEQTLCIGTEILYPKVFELFKNRMIILKDNEIAPLWLKRIGMIASNTELPVASRINPLVSNFGLVAASILGFKQVYMAGVDNGVIDDSSVTSPNLHSRHCIYADESGTEKYKVGYQRISRLFFDYPANFGGNVKTDSLYLSCIRAMEYCITKHSKNTCFYNCSNGAEVKGAKPFRLQNVKLGKENFDFTKFKQELISGCRSFSLTVDDLKKIIDVEGYCRFVDDTVRILTEIPKDRLEFIEIEEKLLDNIEKTKINDWYKMFLSGSLSYMLLPVNEYLYSAKDEESSLRKAGTFIKIITEFLNITKEIIPFALEYVQNEHVRVVENAKKKYEKSLGD